MNATSGFMCDKIGLANPQLFYSCDESCIDSGDASMMMFATTFVMLQTPALGIAQAGSIRRKNALSMLMQVLTGTLVGSLLWFLIGLSLTFGESQGGFIGWNSDFLILHNVPFGSCLEVAPTIPSHLWIAFQMMFALMVPVLVTGAWAEKMTFSAFLVFIVAFPLLVYYPLAHWEWGDGWLYTLGSRDFAGGITINCSSGAAGFVVSLMMTRRRRDNLLGHHNLPLMIVGGVLVWAGWYSFNGGSAFRANTQAAVALINTHISACTSGVVWVLLMYFKQTPHHWHLTEIMSGALAGLAGITPGSGFVDPWAAVVIGMVVGVCSWTSVRIFKERLLLDDVLDVTSLQGVPGAIGSILSGLLANPAVGGLDSPRGAFFDIDGEGWRFFGLQVLAVIVALSWSALMTFLLLSFMRHTVGIDIDATVEEKGLDLTQIGEQAYDDTLDLHLDLGKELAQTLLCEACGAGSVQEVEALVRKGASPTAPDYDGRTPCHIAASLGRYSVLQYLIDNYHVDVNAKDNFGGTPLRDAVENKHLRCAQLLRARGARADDTTMILSLLEAVSANDMEEVRTLLSCGVPVDAGDYDLRTPLHLACANGFRDMINLLIEENVMINPKDRWNRTPMDDLIEFGHQELIPLLSTQGADVSPNGFGYTSISAMNAKNKKKRSEEEHSKEKRSSVELSSLLSPRNAKYARDLCTAAGQGDLNEVKRLLKRKADPNAGDYDFRTPLHVSAMHGHVKVVRFLLAQRGINVNPMDRWKRTPLMEASKNKHVECVKLLRAAGGSVVNQAAGSRLCQAAADGDLDTLKDMLDDGDNDMINVADYDGRTCLHLAVCCNCTEIVEFLVARGCRVDARDRFGNTAIDDAKREGHTHLLPILETAQTRTATTDALPSVAVANKTDGPGRRRSQLRRRKK